MADEDSEQGKLRKPVMAMRRWVMHPHISFGGNLTFIIGTGIFVAGLVGGVLRQVADFPTVWLVLVAIGAFMAASGAIVTFVPAARRTAASSSEPSVDAADMLEEARKERERAEDQRRREEDQIKLRRAIRLIREELRDDHAALSRVVKKHNIRTPLRIEKWESEGQVLLDYGEPVPYEAASEAYRHIKRLEQTQWITTPLGERERLEDGPLPDMSDVVPALNAILAAIRALTKAEEEQA